MNRYEANRIAKRIFFAEGLQAEVDWQETCSNYDVDEADEELVQDYFDRCAKRVHQWLRL